MVALVLLWQTKESITPLSANTYTAPSGKIFKEWNTAADGTGTSYTDQQSVTNIATVGTTLPLYAIWFNPIYMQDMSFDECTTEGITVYDRRDMQEYTAAKLADGDCWMTTNLNLAGGTALSADDTDVDASYINNFTTSRNLTKTGDTIVLPASSQSGFDINFNADVYNSPSTDCSSSSGCYSYYSWDAATLGSGRNLQEDNVEAPYSICPKGWRLPTSGDTIEDGWKRGDFHALATAYGANLESNFYDNSSATGANFYNNAGPGTTPNFLLAGYYRDGSFARGGSSGGYWSSTSSTDVANASQSLGFQSYRVYASNYTTRDFGYSIRCIKDSPSLYKKVQKMSKGGQTNDEYPATDIQVNPTAPTSSVTVSPNSGVYVYNSSAFGTDSDGTKSNGAKATIFYYRGILDSYGNTATYGSAGKSDAYPNYVILQTGDSKATTDTCWRIIRTTGSGGVKMIYNGTWTGSTCANSQADAMIKSPVTTSTFNGTADQAQQVVRVGYTHNSTYATTTSSSVAVDTLFGSDSNFSVNNGDSTIKENIETWFNNTLSDFDDADMFESNANYCNDRSAFQNTTGTTATTNLYSYTTYTGTGATYRAYFGPYVRNATSNKAPSLGCSRSTVDRYSTDTAAGGNGQLSVPVALITADEASFAGSGSNTAANGSGYSSTSFLRNGSNFWTMSPYYRSVSYAYDFYMNTYGYMTYGRIDLAYGVRPVVSLKEGTPVTSGTGISTDPWVVTIPVEEPDPVPDPISCAANYICYAPNSYDNSVEGTMGRQSASASTTVKLFASNFSREGYGFAG